MDHVAVAESALAGANLRNSKRVPAGKSPAARSTETVAVLDVGFVGREAGWRRWFAPHDVGVAAVG